MANLFESNAGGETNFSFEGHCAITNAEIANEVQENVVIVKKGKKRGIEARRLPNVTESEYQLTQENLLHGR